RKGLCVSAAAAGGRDFVRESGLAAVPDPGGLGGAARGVDSPHAHDEKGTRMFLHKLELQGFKSFVDKTELQFGEGITGVIGPNGCGKTNVSDAIRWV